MAAPSAAQNISIYGSIVGTVTDASGGAVPGVRVAATNTATGITNAAATNAIGFYRIDGLIAGEYRVESEAPGFRKSIAEGVALSSAQTVRVDIGLQVGAVEQSVEITAEAPLINTESAQLASVTSWDMRKYLPTSNPSLFSTLETNSVTGGPSAPVADFLRKLYQALKSADAAYHVSYASPPVISPRDRFAVSWLDWPAMAGSLDAIVPMLYTANPPSIGWSTGAEPMGGGKVVEGMVPRDVATLMGDYFSAVPEQDRGKLLLGINSFPWPGYEFRCESPARLARTLERGKTQPFEYLEAQAAQYGKRWDYQQQCCWYRYQDGDAYVQGWYDDDHSWAAKLDYVNQQNLGGVGVWVVDGQTDSPAMWDLLRNAFSAPRAKV